MKAYQVVRTNHGDILVQLSEPLNGATFVWLSTTPFGKWAAFRSNESGSVFFDEDGIADCVSTIVGGDGGWTDVLSVDGYVDVSVADILANL